MFPGNGFELGSFYDLINYSDLCFLTFGIFNDILELFLVLKK